MWGAWSPHLVTAVNLERTVVSTLKCVCSLYPPWACSSLSFSTESVEPCSVLRLWPHPEHSGDSTRLVATLSRLVHVAVHRFILCHADGTRGAQMKPRSWVCLCACVELSLAQGWQDSVKQPCGWASSNPRSPEENKRQRKEEFAPFSSCPLACAALSLGFTPASLVLNLQTWTKLHHQRPRVSSLQRAGHGTSQPL